MAGRRKVPVPFPSDDDILRFINENPSRVHKREIARAFHLDAAQKMKLKKRLRKMELDGTLQRGRGKRLSEAGTLPNVGVIKISALDGDGDVLARPLQWDHDSPVPVIYMTPGKPVEPALGMGERLLARLIPQNTKNEQGAALYDATIIRRLSAAAATVMGVLEETKGRFRLKPTDRRNKSELLIEHSEAGSASAGDLVRAEVLPGKRLGIKQGRVIETLAASDSTRVASLIAIHEHSIPTEFSPEALHIAETAKAAPMAGREDLRNVPLITIDGADARDFDDAVWAEPDPDPANKGGWHVIVAIADVAWYVRPGSALDVDAYQRGNSVYFPDQVVPMLPEALSNGWCSLVANEDRPCMVVHLWLHTDGSIKNHRFSRAMIRSHARLTYEQAQKARDGEPDEATELLCEPVLAPLYGAYKALSRARNKRGALELDLPERQIIMAEDGTISSITVRERYDSHRLIEEFMIAANVAAAETLEKFHQPCMYRIHDQPSAEKMQALREFLDSLSMKLPKGQVIRAQQFNSILARAVGTPNQEIVNTIILRSQSQAEYSPDNIGHFGLNLHKYSHFTSPIRRYSDLLVHRALISGMTKNKTLGKTLSKGGLDTIEHDFAENGTHLSRCERRAAIAERDANDRLVAGYMAEHVGEEFTGRINGVTRFGLFIKLSDTGAEGLLPISTLPHDYYIHDEAQHCLRGRRHNKTFVLGQTVGVILIEAIPLTGGMVLRLSEDDDEAGIISGPKPKLTRRGVPKRSQKKHRKKPGKKFKSRGPTKRGSTNP